LAELAREKRAVTGPAMTLKPRDFKILGACRFRNLPANPEEEATTSSVSPVLFPESPAIDTGRQIRGTMVGQHFRNSSIRQLALS
jgi:hypothetical protein